ncbi:hypothetical protein QL285_087309 [Trifolium repens]|nr:hypothetical protein QL285_087309 [Trifolium repens]
MCSTCTNTLFHTDSYLDILLTNGTEPRIIHEFFTPLVGVTLLTHVVLTTIAATSDSKDLHSYPFSRKHSYFILTTRPPWSTSVLNRNTLTTIHDTELIRFSM